MIQVDKKFKKKKLLNNLQVGIKYSIGGDTGNTMDSHRLIYYAGTKGMYICVCVCVYVCVCMRVYVCVCVCVCVDIYMCIYVHAYIHIICKTRRGSRGAVIVRIIVLR